MTINPASCVQVQGGKNTRSSYGNTCSGLFMFVCVLVCASVFFYVCLCGFLRVVYVNLCGCLCLCVVYVSLCVFVCVCVYAGQNTRPRYGNTCYVLFMLVCVFICLCVSVLFILARECVFFMFLCVWFVCLYLVYVCLCIAYVYM